MTEPMTHSFPVNLSRRHVVAGGAALAATLSAGLVAPALANHHAMKTGEPFKLDYAPHFGSFENLAGEDFVGQLEFAHEQGFRSWEDNRLPTRDEALQNTIARTLERLDMRMGVFVAHALDWKKPTLTLGDPDINGRFLEQITASVDLAKRVRAKWMTVVVGVSAGKIHPDYQFANVLDVLRRASDILEPHGLVMVLEPLNHFANHPGQFLSTVSQGYALCRAVDSPSCKLLFDIYHQQIQQGNIIPNLDRCWDEIGYIQVGDTPGRTEPGSGEINYRNVFSHIHAKGYTGILGMEHKASMPGAEGERALIKAYRKSDNF